LNDPHSEFQPAFARSDEAGGPAGERPAIEVPLLERPQLPELNLPVAEAAPLAITPPASPPLNEAAKPPADVPVSVPPFPRALLAELWRQIAAFDAASIKDWLPLLRLLALAVAAGVVLQMAGATLHAIDGVPLMGGLLELVGLVSVLSFLARNALRQQKRAELLARIHKLRRDLLG
jgi:hypothetical protein